MSANSVEILDVNQASIATTAVTSDHVEVAVESIASTGQVVDRQVYIESMERGPQGEPGSQGSISPVTVSTITGTAYTLVLTDAGKALETTNAAAVTVTIPTDASVAFPVGTILEVAQAGTGLVTVAPAAGVTIRTPSTSSLVTKTQWSRFSLRKRAANEWMVTLDDFSSNVLTSYLKQVINDVSITDMTNQYLAQYTLVDDGSTTTAWPNRLSFSYKPSGVTAHLTGYFNEYGELRVVPGKNNTVPFRIFGGTAAADYTARTAGVNLFEIQTDRANRTNLFTVGLDGSVVSAGTVSGTNIGAKVVSWPTGSEPSLTGVPDGTLWVEYTP